MKKVKYYSLDKILSRNAAYNMIIGERSNGKTYSVLKYALEDYIKNKNQLAIVRRWNDDLRGRRGATLFDALVNNNIIEELTDGDYNSVYYYSGRWYLMKNCFNDKGKEERLVSDEPFAYSFALTTSEHDKSTSYPRVKTIMFDEFITRTAYLPDEFVLFMNTISTIVRDRNDVKIFMLGNTVNKYCPYFNEMGLKHIKFMEQGKIDVYTYGDSDLKVAVEYCKKNKDGKSSDSYFAFDNPKLQMITGGVWEVDIYPHLPCKYKPKDVLFTYFIKFDNDVLQCEIIKVDKNYFTFIHPKTTPLKHTDKDLIYSTETSPKPNYHRRINSPTKNIHKKIYRFFVEEKVFYSSNECGEIVRNYLNWCNKN